MAGSVSSAKRKRRKMRTRANISSTSHQVQRFPRVIVNEKFEFEEVSLKPIRTIEIFPESSDLRRAPKDRLAGASPCCYEYQVESYGTRLFLRTTLKHESIHTRRLRPKAVGSRSLISVDDRVETKLWSQEFSASVDSRHPSSFMRRNALWLLALAMLMLGNHVYSLQAGAWQRTFFAGLAVTPYNATALLVLIAWLSVRWPSRQNGDRVQTVRRREKRSLSDVTSSLGEFTEAVDNVPAMSFADCDSEAARQAGLLYVEGVAAEVEFCYIDRKGDEYDDSSIVCDFVVQRLAGDVVCCRIEVRKKSSLFFLRDGNFVRVLGRVKNKALEVEHALNRTDGHVFTVLQSIWWTKPRYRPPGSRLSLFLRESLNKSIKMLSDSTTNNEGGRRWIR
jgi:hypothetical protein